MSELGSRQTVELSNDCAHQGLMEEPPPEAPAVAWCMGVEPVPLEAVLEPSLQPALALVSRDTGVPRFFSLLREREEPITTCEQLKNNITDREIKLLARGVIRPATLTTLATILSPPRGFRWPQGEQAVEKRGRGGRAGQNNRPTTLLKDQLRDEGVEALNPATFKWGEHVFDGVPKKGPRTDRPRGVKSPVGLWVCVLLGACRQSLGVSGGTPLSAAACALPRCTETAADLETALDRERS